MFSFVFPDGELLYPVEFILRDADKVFQGTRVHDHMKERYLFIPCSLQLVREHFIRFFRPGGSFRAGICGPYGVNASDINEFVSVLKQLAGTNAICLEAIKYSEVGLLNYMKGGPAVPGRFEVDGHSVAYDADKSDIIRADYANFLGSIAKDVVGVSPEAQYRWSDDDFFGPRGVTLFGDSFPPRAKPNVLTWIKFQKAVIEALKAKHKDAFDWTMITCLPMPDLR